MIVPRMIRLTILVLGITYKKTWIGLENLDKLKQNDQNWIYSTWHNNILMAALFLKNQNLVSLVSSSADGRIAARVLELMGNQTIAGSSSRNGTKALLTMRKLINSGQKGAITPDGPRGPRYKLQEGIIYIAQKSGAAMVPIHMEATHQWIFEKSWDRHKLPKPFATVVISVGKPYWVSSKLSKAELEKVKNEFEAKMLENVSQTIKIIENIKDNL
ncbi:MAG: lysophospholipid acyltransferase family protein [SAR324 cluster bacterium]|nr:lysophospholipid acyltransferase family protein [SAR324 cluster bacterium]